MSHKVWAVILVIGFIFAVGSAVFLSKHPVVPEAEVPAPVSVEDLSGKSIYASGEYGFTLIYPASSKLGEYNNPSAHGAWRVNALPESTGITVFDIVTYDTASENSYPRFYRAMVRLGVSEDTGEVAGCEQATPNAGEKALPDIALNGTTWHAFSFEDAAMMQYEKGVSYRVVHEGKCFALEKIALGSSYRDDPESADDIPDSELLAEYAKLDDIIASFAFSRP